MDPKTDNLPGTFPAEERTPWAAWVNAIRWNLGKTGETQEGTIPSFTRVINKKEERQFVEALKLLVVQSPVNSPSLKSTWTHGLKVIQAHLAQMKFELPRLWTSEF